MNPFILLWGNSSQLTWWTFDISNRVTFSLPGGLWKSLRKRHTSWQSFFMKCMLFLSQNDSAAACDSIQTNVENAEGHWPPWNNLVNSQLVPLLWNSVSLLLQGCQTLAPVSLSMSMHQCQCWQMDKWLTTTLRHLRVFNHYPCCKLTNDKAQNWMSMMWLMRQQNISLAEQFSDKTLNDVLIMLIILHSIFTSFVHWIW